MIGLITNYKFYESSTVSEHFYEIRIEGNDREFYYAHGKEGDAVIFGTEVEIDLTSNTVIINGYQFPVLGPFERLKNVINYQGFVVDCLDSDIGVYNLDNEIFLFGSACLDLPIGISVTLYNLHLMRLTDTNWIYRLFGSSLKKSTHVLVYCPAFSSYLEGTEHVSYDNIISIKANFASLIYANKWLKTNLQIEFPGFQSLDEFASVLFPENYGKSAAFLGHCEKCIFTDNFTDLLDFLHRKTLLTSQALKENFIKIKDELQNSNIYSNQTLNCTKWLRNEIVYGTVKRKNSVLFEVCSGDKVTTIFCNDSSFAPEDDCFILIFNALQIVELVPKLRIIDSWSTKAYLWISPETRVWSPTGYFWSSSSSADSDPPANHISCKIIRKYLIQKEIEFVQYEIIAIQVESEKGLNCFYLNPKEKYYGILSGALNEGISVLRYFIDESFFKASDEPLLLPSSAIKATLSCTLTVDSKQQGPLQVRVNDLPFLPQVKGLQFFSLTLRTYSISSLFIRLTCLKCKSQVESGKCLNHYDNFVPNLQISAVIETSDMDGTSCNVLIDKFSFLEEILGTAKTPFKNDLIKLLKAPGSMKLSSDHFSFSNFLKQSEKSLESSAAELFPSVSKVVKFTFPISLVNFVLKPVSIEICDPKVELIKILRLIC